MSAPPNVCQKLTSCVSLLCPCWGTPGLRPPEAAPLRSCRASVWGGGCAWSLLEDTLGAGVGTMCAHSSHTPFLGDTPGTPVAQALRPRAPTSLPWQGLCLSCTQDGVPVTHSVRGEATRPRVSGQWAASVHRPPPPPSAPSEEGASQQGHAGVGSYGAAYQRVPWCSGVGGGAGLSVPGFLSPDSPVVVTLIPAGAGTPAWEPVRGRRRVTSRALITLD